MSTLDAALPGDLAQFGQQRRVGARAHGVGRAAHVDGELDATGDHVLRAGQRLMRPTVATSSGSAAADALDRQDHLAGRGERVAARRPSARCRRGRQSPSP